MRRALDREQVDAADAVFDGTRLFGGERLLGEHACDQLDVAPEIDVRLACRTSTAETLQWQ